MKVSVITACFNSEATLEDTLRSVLAQDHPDLEYLVIDGASKDRSLEIVERYRPRLARVVSEPDRGIYDAINKGIGLATGDVVGILHSDDLFAGPSVVSKVAALFEKTGCDAVYADLRYVDRLDPTKVVRYWRSGEYKPGDCLRGWMPPHPTFYAKREVLLRHGLYDLRLPIAADYELMLRLIHKHGISPAYLPEVAVDMREGGMSTKNLKARLQGAREVKEAWALNGLKPGRLTFLRKIASKLGQYVSRPKRSGS